MSVCVSVCVCVCVCVHRSQGVGPDPLSTRLHRKITHTFTVNIP